MLHRETLSQKTKQTNKQNTERKLIKEGIWNSCCNSKQQRLMLNYLLIRIKRSPTPFPSPIHRKGNFKAKRDLRSHWVEPFHHADDPGVSQFVSS